MRKLPNYTDMRLRLEACCATYDDLVEMTGWSRGQVEAIVNGRRRSADTERDIENALIVLEHLNENRELRWRPDRERFCNFLAKVLKHRRIAVKDLAAAAGYTVSYINYTIRDNRENSLKFRRDVVVALNLIIQHRKAELSKICGRKRDRFGAGSKSLGGGIDPAPTFKHQSG
jgi:transcriptional regulator with XRE-family HTH domain